MVGERRSTSHFANVRRVGGAPAGSGVEEGRGAGLYRPFGLEKIAALQNVSLAMVSAAFRQNQLERSFGVLAPERGDGVVFRLPFRNGGAPVAEYRADLRGRALFTRNAQDFAHILRQRVGHGAGRGGNREANAAQVVVLIIVGVPAPVILLQAKTQNRPVRVGHRLVRTGIRLCATGCAIRDRHRFPMRFRLCRRWRIRSGR